MSYVSRQEMFDANALLSATDVLVIHAFDKLWEKHMADIKSVGFTDSYYADVKALAVEFDVNFTEPKFAGGPTVVVGNNTTH